MIKAIQRFCGLAGACLILVSLPAAAEEATFTRKDVANLSSPELAAKVLAAVAQKSLSAKEQKFYISPVLPTPPWLERVVIAMPATYLTGWEMCRSSVLTVSFEPVADEATRKARFFDQSFDPPATVSAIYDEQKFADAPSGASDADCAGIAADKYFTASDNSSAAQAMAAFRLFRAEVSANPNSHALHCRVAVRGAGSCDRHAAVLSAMTGFTSVISRQDDTRDGVITRTVVVSVESSDDAKAELWLKVTFGGPKVELTSAELVYLPPDPVI